MLSYLGLSDFILVVMALNLVVGAALLVSVRFLMGLATNVNSLEELSQRDNPAFGITMAGAILGVGIIGTGVISGDPAATLGHEALLLVCYSAGGLAAILVSRQIFDRISLPHLPLRAAVRSGNIAAALTDAGNAVATAIIVRSVINWVVGSEAIVAAIAFFGFIVSQVILSLVSYYRIQAYNRAHDASFQTALKEGNAALAVRFAGFQIGAALAIGSALNLVPYDPATPLPALMSWLAACGIVLVLLFALSWASARLLLGKIDLREEVDRQANVAIAVTQAALVIAIGFAFLAATA